MSPGRDHQLHARSGPGPSQLPLDRAREKHGHLTRTSIIPGPDQLFSNGPEILKALKAWARERGTLFHCHSSEELGTTRWFEKEYGKTPVQYAHELGILDEETVLAHQVQTTPEDLAIAPLVARASAEDVTEVMLAMSATVEGQTTAHYRTERLAGCDVEISRLAHGVPVGGELDYLDDGTLAQALKARHRF